MSVYGTPAYAVSEASDGPGTPHSVGAMSVELHPEHSARRSADRGAVGGSAGYSGGEPRGRGGVGETAALPERGAEALRLPNGKMSTVWMSASMAVDTSFAPWAES